MLATPDTTEATQYHLFIDSVTRAAIGRYKSRYPGTTNKGLVTRAIEYYVCWLLNDLGWALPDSWNLSGDRPREIKLVKEKKGENNYYSTVLIDATHNDPVEDAAKEIGESPRKIVMKAVRAYLIDQGFLNVES